MTSVSEILTALKQRSVDIDCVEMTLIQNSEETALFFNGLGYIRQSEDDQLTFKISAAETRNTGLLEDLERVTSQEAGGLLRDADYFSLRAVAVDGKTWTADRVLPECYWPMTGGTPIVTGKVSELSTELPAFESSQSLALHFFEDVRIPCLAKQCSFSAVGCRFTVRNGDHEFFVGACGAGTSRDMLHMRIQEALRFLLAQSVDWRVLIYTEGERQQLRLASAAKRARKSQLGQPISGDYGCIEDCWRLFSLYLKYVVTTTPIMAWNRCSYHLYNACEASVGSVDAWAVGVSVAVEGIANLLDAELPAEERNRLAQLTESVVKHITSQPCLTDFAERVKGLLGMMRNVRVQDRLRPLIEKGYADPTYMEAWSLLRNKHVHPGKSNLGDKTITDYHQELFGLINKTTVLMYASSLFAVGWVTRR